MTASSENRERCGVVYVCPDKDIVCGDAPARWCATCPKRAPTTVALNFDQLAHLASIARVNGTQDAFIGIALQWAKQAVDEVARLQATTAATVEDKENAARYLKIISKEHVHPVLRELVYYASQSYRTNYTTPENVRNAKTINDMVDEWRKLPD